MKIYHISLCIYYSTFIDHSLNVWINKTKKLYLTNQKASILYSEPSLMKLPTSKNRHIIKNTAAA
ncbi:TPA: hypothetical protein DF272_03550 [Candidatus Falkowbacteria bacterium]|nr:hypothetical protein [Candidatus Falkowbacteria bacterium]